MHMLKYSGASVFMRAATSMTIGRALMSHETREMIGDRDFGKMKPGCYVINTARGQIVNPKVGRKCSQKWGKDGG